jgi:hypothetical protein
MALNSLKACMSCKLVKYCNAKCQNGSIGRSIKKLCKLRAAELHDEALFKDPPPKEDCPICFLPMPAKFISCLSLPPATIFSVPIYDYAEAKMRSWQIRLWKYILNVAERVYVEGAYTHSLNLVTWGNVHFVNQRNIEKQMKKKLTKLMKRVEANMMPNRFIY